MITSVLRLFTPLIVPSSYLHKLWSDIILVNCCSVNFQTCSQYCHYLPESQGKLLLSLTVKCYHFTYWVTTSCWTFRAMPSVVNNLYTIVVICAYNKWLCDHSSCAVVTKNVLCCCFSSRMDLKYYEFMASLTASNGYVIMEIDEEIKYIILNLILSTREGAPNIPGLC